MPISSSNLDYLIDSLRLHLGDIDSTSYRYTDEWLRTALVLSVEALMRWWDNKYLLDSNYNVYRNPNWDYLLSSPPIIQISDERPIILMAGIIIKEGTLENSSWNIGAWRDAEISYSNIEGSRLRDRSFKRDWDELTSLLTPPNKRLARPRKGSLPGYRGNEYEQSTEW